MTIDAWNDALTDIQDELDQIPVPPGAESSGPWSYDEHLPGDSCSRVIGFARWCFASDRPATPGSVIAVQGTQTVALLRTPAGRWKCGLIGVGGFEAFGSVNSLFDDADDLRELASAFAAAATELERHQRGARRAKFRVVGPAGMLNARL